MPLLTYTLNFFEGRSENIITKNFAQIILGIFLFILPVLFSTFDFAYYKKKYGSYWRWPTLRMDQKDLLESLIPTWKRMLVYFVSGVVSVLVIQAITGQV